MTEQEARRALEASEKLYYRIGEVSKLTGVKAHVLRYWETEFRWMAPPKSRSKQRLYRKRDIEFVWLLKRLLWDERYTIAGARQRIQELGVENALALLDESSDPGKGARSAEPGGAEGKPKKARVAAASGDASAQASASSAAGSGAASSTVAATAGQATDWQVFQSALGDLRAELCSLRGLLQEGA